MSDDETPPLLSSPLHRKTALPADRLIAFSDAVVAIAITLLVLPLIELVTEETHTETTPAVLVGSHLVLIGSFLISFVAIWRIWTVHHQLFAHTETVGGGVTFVNMIWLACIAFLPFPVGLIGSFGTDSFVLALYVGVLLVSSATLAVIALMLRRAGGDQTPDRIVVEQVVGNAICLAAAFVIVLVVPAAGFWPLLLLLLDGPVIAAIHRLRHRPKERSPR
ncbi:TMEM175 family protein [Pseudonocardia phyllosphaerae]|uniref:TMEM175 family protein n=1 Tax=Pseudonocardia phyllosphaerae TaxID=3390502 RepID=UPI003979D096